MYVYKMLRVLWNNLYKMVTWHHPREDSSLEMLPISMTNTITAPQDVYDRLKTDVPAMQNILNKSINHWSNTPGTAGGPGGRNRTLAVKRRKDAQK